MQYTLELSNVNKEFKNFKLCDVSFRLASGSTMGFIGPNGAGKTTVINLILNILRRKSGEINIFGKDNIKNEVEIKEKLGVVMDSPFYVDEWTVAEVGKAQKPFYKQWDSSLYDKLTADFLLESKKKVRHLSRGMKMKLMIACALSHNAELLILDEPTSGLDSVARNELAQILTSFVSDKNKAILFSTHITTDLEKIADSITFINKGRIVSSDTKDSLIKKYVTVKGRLGILSPEQQRLVIGYQEQKDSFEGIILQTESRSFHKEVITEPCGLDELVVRFNIGG